MGALIDLTGKMFGRLRVVERSATQRRAHVTWTCVCVCGAVVHVSGPELRGGDTQSCGCLARERLLARNLTHGMSKHPGYQAWCSMKVRCDPEGPFADRYFQRGITVCERWEYDFEAFWEDMGETFRKGLTLERVDNDQGYSPNNCVWADRFVQANNTRRSRIIETSKGSMTVAQAARAFGVPRPTISERLRLGKSITDLVGA